jgi:hypothetical protein
MFLAAITSGLLGAEVGGWVGGGVGSCSTWGGRCVKRKSAHFHPSRTIPSNKMNAHLLAQLDEKKNLAPSLSRAQLARNLSSHFRRVAAAAAAPAPILDEDSKSSVACVQVHPKVQQHHPERVPQIRGKVTKSEQRQRRVLCVQQPRGTYIAQTGPGYSSQ